MTTEHLLDLDPKPYLGRKVTLRAVASLVTALETSRPRRMSGVEGEAFREMLEVREEANVAIARKDRVKVGITVLAARNAVLGAIAGMMAVLDALARVTEGGLGARAAAVRWAVLQDRRDFVRMKPREMWHLLERLGERLGDEPALRQQLEGLVQPEMVTRLLDAQAALGGALGITRKREEPLPDLRRLVAKVNQRVDRYALAVLSTARPEAPETVLRAKEALCPILEVREENARRRPRGAAAPTHEMDAPTVVDGPPPVHAPTVVDVDIGDRVHPRGRGGARTLSR